MELRTLKYLVSLAEEKSLTRAAAKNFVSQPAVSIALKKLSEELKVSILEVHGRQVRLTRAGEVVLRYGERIMELVEELQREISDYRVLKGGSLELGTIDAASLYVLPEVFARFHTIYPMVQVHLEIASTGVLLGALFEGRVDAVIATIPSPVDERLEVHPIFSENLVLIAPVEHPLSKRMRVEPGELVEYPFISFHRGAVTRGIIEETLAGVGVSLKVSMEIDSPEVIKRLVSTGLGLAVLPSRIVEGDVKSGELVRIDIEGVEITRQMGMMWRKDRYIPLHLRAFAGVLSKVLGVELPAGIVYGG